MKSKYIFFLILNILLGFKIVSQTINSNIATPISAAELELAELVPDSLGLNKIMLMPPCGANAANNNFASAQLLVVNGGSVVGTACGNLEAGEQLDCNGAALVTVWYRFIATSAVSFVKIDLVSGSCFIGSSVYNTTVLPTTACANVPLSCQMSASGPATQIHHLTNLVVGATYYIQITHPGSSGCAANFSTFNIGVTSANPGGYITNPPPNNTCAAPFPGCYFTAPPAVAAVTGGCPSYSLNALSYSANAVWTGYFQFTNSPLLSTTAIQAIITSNCGAGNVNYLNWSLYNSSCGLMTCGNLSNLTLAGVACSITYIIYYRMELANCTSFVQFWPYQNAPAGSPPCTVLPIELLYFTVKPQQDNTVILEWESVMEKNSKEYKLYKSNDGINFDNIKTLRSNNSSGKYQLTADESELKNTTTTYYKLDHIDFDNKITYSKTLTSVTKNKTELVKIAPNPASDNFEIIFSDNYLNTDVLVEMYNLSGEKVLSHKLFVDNKIKEVNIESFAKGVYVLNLIGNTNDLNITKVKLVKN